MKTAAILALCVGIAAAVASIVLQTVKIIKTGKKEKSQIGSLVFAAVFIVIAVLNLFIVIPNLK